MKIKTESIKLPAHWASALINGDYSGCTDNEEKSINEWLRDNPHLSPVDCSENSELNMFEGLLTDTLEFNCYVQFYRTNENGLHYLVYPAFEFTNELPWQKLCLQYTASGYGSKIPTTKMLSIMGKRYRIYCTIHSNIGTCWINFDGKKVIYS